MKRHSAPSLRLAAFLAALVGTPAALAQEKFATAADFSVTYTFTTSTPAAPIDIGGGRDLIVNRYLTTTINDAGSGFLHLTAGHCTNVRFFFRERNTLDSKGYCQFKDRDGDQLFAEYTTAGEKAANAITLDWTFTTGTGKYDGIQGGARATNSNNIDDQGAYQAAGKLTGHYRIVRLAPVSDPGLNDR